MTLGTREDPQPRPEGAGVDTLHFAHFPSQPLDYPGSSRSLQDEINFIRDRFLYSRIARCKPVRIASNILSASNIYCVIFILDLPDVCIVYNDTKCGIFAAGEALTESYQRVPGGFQIPDYLSVDRMMVHGFDTVNYVAQIPENRLYGWCVVAQ